MAVAGTAAREGLPDTRWIFATTLGGVFSACGALPVTLWCMGGVWLARHLASPIRWRLPHLSLAPLLAPSVFAPWP